MASRQSSCRLVIELRLGRLLHNSNIVWQSARLCDVTVQLYHPLAISIPFHHIPFPFGVSTWRIIWLNTYFSSTMASFSSLSSRLQQSFVAADYPVVVTFYASFGQAICHLWLWWWQCKTVDENIVWNAVSFNSDCRQLNVEYFVRSRRWSYQFISSAVCHSIGSIWRNSGCSGTIYVLVVTYIKCRFPSSRFIEGAFVASLARGQLAWDSVIYQFNSLVKPMWHLSRCHGSCMSLAGPGNLSNVFRDSVRAVISRWGWISLLPKTRNAEHSENFRIGNFAKWV